MGIHCLILVSLFLQVFLFLFGGTRRRCSWWLLRSVLWLAYVSADSVAVFVLGHLAVHASEPRHQLMSFWAPFVLLHLGGQDTISAFAKQDNEIWLRHLLNLVTQVVVAAYVVIKGSWPDRRLLAAMVLMFFCGCFKYAERTIILFSANPERLSLWTKGVLSRKLNGWKHVRGRFVKTEGTREEAIKAVEETVQVLSEGRSTTAYDLFWEAVTLGPDVILLDAPLNHQAHSTAVAAEHLPGILQKFLSAEEDKHRAYEHVAALLEHCYRRFYTKDPVRETLISGGLLPFVVITLFPFASTTMAQVLFIVAEKGDQLHASRVDVRVSYLLLIVAILLDVCSTAIYIISHMRSYLPTRILYLASYIQPSWWKKPWSQKLKQYYMIRSALMNPIKQFFGDDVISTPVTEDHTSIKMFILDTLLGSVARKQWSIASTRGQLALRNWMNSRQHHHSVDSAWVTLKALQETVIGNVDFPTSILIWHIATDICYHFGGTNCDQLKKKKQMSRELSNYILYLIFKCGVMLTTSSQLVHDSALNEIVEIFGPPRRVRRLCAKDTVMKIFEERRNKNDPRDEHEESEGLQHSMDEIIELEELSNNDSIAANHIKKIIETSKTLKSPVLPRACVVAQELITINDEADRWDLIATLWAEMVYYTASRCGGNFHYDYLSTGGEFITHVLVLMNYLGPFLPSSDAWLPSASHDIYSPVDTFTK